MRPRKKTPRELAPPSRKTSRRWRVPPPLTHGPEALESGSILDEMPTGLGTLLWRSLRDVMLWAATPPADRARLFAPGAEAAHRALTARLAPPAELADPLEVVGALLGGAEALPEEEVAAACQRVAGWAEDEGLLALALDYAQAVASSGEETRRPRTPSASSRGGGRSTPVRRRGSGAR